MATKTARAPKSTNPVLTSPQRVTEQPAWPPLARWLGPPLGGLVGVLLLWKALIRLIS